MAKVRIDPPQLTAQEIKRFWSYVDKSPGQGPKGDCHAWVRGTSSRGYGTFRAKNRRYGAHRIVFFFSNNSWPSLQICHRCDNPPCCNPIHLFKGTAKDNAQDRAAKERGSQGVNHYSRFRPESVAHGESHWKAKLTAANVLQIRALHNKGNRTQQSIADQFGVTVQMVNRIIKRIAWKHI